MNWDYFIYFASASVLLWIIASALAFKSKKKLMPTLLTTLGLVVFFCIYFRSVAIVGATSFAYHG